MRVPLIMRVIPILALTVLLAAQEPWKPPLTSRIKTSTRQVVLFTNLETQMLQAVQKKNQAALTAMLTDDFAIDMPNADRMAGEDWVDSVMSKDFTLEKFGVHQMSVIDLGNAAVVKYERLQQATQKGDNENGEFFVIDLWKKDGDNWKLADRYVSKVSSVIPADKSEPKPTGKQ
ncbi:MAG TPA: nuclear transport factor 2 family protein [Candidatus Angelobacter sp.]|nr:nuclear transport factor 2 family protein [Candidatus Angelobacter sp.]